MKLHIKKGDTVMLISGKPQYRGQTGSVLEVRPKEYRAIVEGLNIVSKHSKPTAQNTQGGIVKQEAPIHLSNLMLIDPKTQEPTRVGRKYDETGKLRRYAKKSGEFID
jgi:large subunit ribosomal protein L24